MLAKNLCFLSKGKVKRYLLALIVFLLVLLPLPAEFGWASVIAEKDVEVESIYPVIKKKQPKQVLEVRLTAYSSSPGQTNGNPFITASGAHVHDGTIAANCLEFGTKVKFPELYGDKFFVVEDRLAARMGCGVVDIWFSSYQEAISFGSRYSKIEVY